MRIGERRGASPLMEAVFAVITVLGVSTVAYGFTIPANVFATSTSTDCSNWPTNCATTAQVTSSGLSNNGYTFVAPYFIYFVYHNTAGQVMLIDKMSWTSAQSSVTDSNFNPTTVPGAGSTLLGFTVNVFFWDANGSPMGPSSSATFTVPMKFQIAYAGVGSISVNPPGSSPNAGGTTSGTYIAYWASGTKLTITTSAGVAPVTSIPANLCAASPSGAGFTCGWTVTNSVNVISISGGASVSQNAILVFSVNGGGGVSPQEICLSASPFTMTTPTISCNPTGTFTLTQPAAWSVQDQNTGAVYKTGSGPSATLSYSDYSNQVTFSAGLAALNFVTQAPVTLVIETPSVAGVTITPAPGTYICSATSSVCQPGGTVKLNATIPPNYQFNEWIITGQTPVTKIPYALTLPTSGVTAVAAVVVYSPPGGGGGGGGGGLSCTPMGTQASIVVYVYADATNKGVQGANAVVTTGSQSGPQVGSNNTNSNGYTCINNFAVPVSSFLGTTGTIYVTVSLSGYQSAVIQVTVTTGQKSTASVGLAGGGSLGGSSAVILGGSVLLFVGLAGMVISFSRGRGKK